MKRLRVGIIGQGRSGRNIHAHSFTTSETLKERYEIVAVSDPLADRCTRAEEEYGCASYLDNADLLKRDDLDLVVNASPSHLHPSITKQILEAGHNVMCEKPLARYTREVDEQIAARDASGKVFAVFQQSRFAPYFQQVQKVLASGVLGRVVLVKLAFNGFARRYDWQTLQENYGGNLLNTGPHPLDQALGIMGRDIMPNVLCVMDRLNTVGDAEDFVKLILTAPERPTIDLEISSGDAFPLYTYHIHGTRGGLTGNTNELKWKYFREEEAAELTLHREPLPGPSYCQDSLEWHEDSWKVSDEDSSLFDTMATAIYVNLYEHMTEGTPLVVTPEQVRQQIAVAEECHRQNPLSRLNG